MNLQLIELPNITLYGPGNNSIKELKDRLRNNGAEYLADSAEYAIDHTSWVFCDALSYQIDSTGNTIVIQYRAEGSKTRHTIATNDVFYIECSEGTPND